MAGIVKRGIVGPECGVQHAVADLSIGVEQKSAAVIEAAFVQLEIEIGARFWVVEDDACDLSGEMAHVKAAERAGGAAKELGPRTLHAEQEAGGLDSAHGQHGLGSFHFKRAVIGVYANAFDSPSVLAEDERG